jgi:hypothetical protein
VSIDTEAVRTAASGRWPEIIASVGNVPAEILDGKHHACPRCGGTDRFRAFDDVGDTGGLFCNQCNSKRCGDGFAAVQWLLGVEFPEALRLIAEYLGITPASTPPAPRDLIADVCRDKRMPIDGFMAFGPTIEKRGRGKNEVVRVPVYDERGEQHSYFDFAVGCKGWFARGKGMAGMFLPGRLPIAGETWHLVEGCKDAAALVGMGLNAAGMPTSNLADKYARLFAGVNIVLVPDLDIAGQSGAQLTGGRLAGIAASVRVARLPGEIVEKGGDDVRDILRRPGGEQLVRDAIAAAEVWTPREGELDPKDGRPEVLLTLAYGHCCDQVTEHIGKLGWQTPWIPQAKRERLKLYERGGELVHIVTQEIACELAGIDIPAGTIRIRPLPDGQLPLRIADACQLMIETETSEGIERKAAPPPKWLVNGVATRGEYGGYVRTLAGVISAPTLRADGTILQTPGYDPRTGLLYRPNDTFPKVTDKPSRKQAQAAAVELLEVIQDFPLIADADRSAWLAYVLTLIGRPAIPGCVPMFGYTSTTRGAGKGLGVDCANVIAYGRAAAKKPYTANDDEMRKSITAVAIEALPSVLLDNVSNGSTLGGSALDAAITSTVWSDRVLGYSKTTGELPLRTVWAATGNNLRFGSDLARRVLPIRLAPAVENPEDRDDFEHADLLGWVRENRPRLAVAALTILRAYVVAGKPVQSGGVWGSFETWSALVRGSIVWCGLADPLETRETAKADDQSGATVAGLIGGLIEIDDSGDGLTVREIVDELNDKDNADRFPTLRDVVAEVATIKGAIDGKRLGYMLRTYRGRIAGGFRIEGQPKGRNKVISWFVSKVVAGDAGDAGDGSSLSPTRGLCVSHDTHKACDTHTYEDRVTPEHHPRCPASPASDSPPDAPRYGREVIL